MYGCVRKIWNSNQWAHFYRETLGATMTKKMRICADLGILRKDLEIMNVVIFFVIIYFN